MWNNSEHFSLYNNSSLGNMNFGGQKLRQKFSYDTIFSQLSTSYFVIHRTG